MPSTIMRSALGATACAVVFVFASHAKAAPSVKVPACDALQAWSATVVATDTYDVAPILKLPKALQDSALTPVFGAPGLSWAKEDIQAASQALVKCYTEAKKRRDKPAMDAYGAANHAILKLLLGTITYLEKARTDAAAQKAAIDALPNTAELDRGLQALLEADPATPVGTAYQGLPRNIVDPLWRLANTARTLAHAEREALYAELAQRRTTIQASLGDETGSTIAATPLDADGALALMQLRLDLAKMAASDTRTALEDGVAARLQEVYAALRAAHPLAWIPPDCPDLYRWSGDPNAQTQVQVGPQVTLAALDDAMAVPVFGLSLADWSDDHLAKFKTLRMLCRASWQSLPQANQVKSPPADAPEILQLASKGRWVEDADSWINNSRVTIAAYRTARATVTENTQRLAALPVTSESLNEIGSLSSDPALNGVSPNERKAFQTEAAMKVHAIRTAALREAASSLTSIEVEKTEDLAKLGSAAAQALNTLPDYESQNTFRNEFQQVLQMAATHVLPDFETKLDKVPASRDGLMKSSSAVSDLTGITGAEDMAPFAPLRNAAVKRSRAIIDEMRTQNCEALWEEIGLGSSDVEEPVWGAGKPGTMGEVVCGMAEGGVEIGEYKGPGMFSKTASLKVTLPMGGLQTITLHKAEVAAKQTMLVGFKMADANQEKTISVQEWELLIAMSTGRQIATKKICDPVMGVPEKNLTASQRMLSVDCAVEIINGRLQ